jgi:RecA-family ATPase
MGTVQKMVDKARAKEIQRELATPADGLRFMHISEFAAQSVDSEVLIKDLLPRAELGVIFGASGSGKTFMALDIAMSLVTGEYWRNGTKRTEKTGVAYIVAEGDVGLIKRTQALKQHRGIEYGDDLPFYLLAASPDFMQAETAQSIAAQVNELPHKIGLVVIDTLARTMRGDENSGEDMGVFIENCKYITRKTKAMTLLIHHSGKDQARGMRGHSTLFASCDSVLEVVRNPTNRGVKIGKFKDDTDTRDAYLFDLKPVVLGINQYGEAITSCVVEHIEPTDVAGLGAAQQQVLNAIRVFAEDRDSFTIAELAQEMWSQHVDHLSKFDPPKPLPQDGGRNFRSMAISKKIPSYLDLPDCGIEVSGEFNAKNAHEVVVTITDVDKFVI